METGLSSPISEEEPFAALTEEEKGRSSSEILEQTSQDSLGDTNEETSFQESSERRPSWTLAELFLLGTGGLFALILLLGNVVALWTAGLAAIVFLILFNLLGLALLCVPYLLWRKRATLNFYEVILGLALALMVLSCLLALTIQAKRYGSHIKAVTYRAPFTAFP